MSRIITCAIVVGILILGSAKCSNLGDADYAEWWKNALVHEIWPASYQDSEGDGIGDLKGIIERLDYIDSLDVDTICLNPIYESPLIDSGFDVSDYRRVHTIYGDLDNFDRLVAEAHARGVKLMLDIVPNHTSDEHPWFVASKWMEDQYTDYYVWANGTIDENGTRLPPNNWISIWDEHERSAWTYNEARDQWYYHKFHEREPDLNLENPTVREEIMDILYFWLDREVDGFRITGAPYFFEDTSLRDEESPESQEYTRSSPRTVEFLYEIRMNVDGWSASHDSRFKYLIAATPDTEENLLSYYGTADSYGVLPSNDYFIRSDAVVGTSASVLGNHIEDWLNAIPLNASTNWMAYTYYGDEIGMRDAPVTSDLREKATTTDPDYEVLLTSPMLWNDSSAAAGQSTDFASANVVEELAKPLSHLNVYKRLPELRRNPVFGEGDWELQTVNDDNVLVLRRTLTDHPIYMAVLNLGKTVQKINMTELYADTSDYLDEAVSSDSDDGEW